LDRAAPPDVATIAERPRTEPTRRTGQARVQEQQMRTSTSRFALTDRRPHQWPMSAMGR
jgi:hypothetical protein